MRYQVTLMFDGSRYSGWQVQENAPTVQGEVCRAARALLDDPSAAVTGCGRTDSGVHAREYVCHIESEKVLDADKIAGGMNRYLPFDISVVRARQAPPGFHARYSCVSKEYEYLIFNGAHRNPFYWKRAYFYPARRLDEERIARASEELIGSHDFRSFMASGSRIEDTVRTMYGIGVRRDGDFLKMTFCADGFLYHMVRILVGTLLEIDGGKKNESIGRILAKRDRGQAGFTAPPEGLYLNRVSYGTERSSDGSKG